MKKSLLLVITSNRGLCGGYNGSIIREAIHAVREHTRRATCPFDLEVSGKRGIAFFKFQGIPRAKEYTNFEDKPTFAQVDELASRYIDLFVHRADRPGEGRVHEVHQRGPAGSRWSRHCCRCRRSRSKRASRSPQRRPRRGTKVDYEFLPDAAEILEELVPAAFKVRLFKCFLDAAVSEQIARRVAMKAATENAGDLIKDITRVYNRTRQANITKEIRELIAGSEALK